VSHQLGKPQEALRLMKRGMEALSPQNTSRAFVVWRFAALDQLLLLGDYPGAIRSFEMASKWAGQTEDYKELEQIFQNSANFLRRNPDSRLVQFQAWSLVYEQAIAIGDKPTQARAEREIIALGGIKREHEGREIFVLPESLRPQKLQKI
jgi:tetratricopeptide (TPR) repeat protein